MGNVGGPSRGCSACRQMKVKCDETKPTCDRCERASRVCPGYPAIADKFRPMNEGSTLKPRQRRRPRRKQTPVLLPGDGHYSAREHSSVAFPTSTASDAPSALTTNGHGSRSPPPLIAIDWEQQAVNFFLYSMVIPKTAIRPLGGYLDFLPAFCADSNRSTCFNNALYAVAFQSISPRTTMRQHALRARLYHTKALSAVQSALNNPIEVRKDETLAALLLLERYQVRWHWYVKGPRTLPDTRPSYGSAKTYLTPFGSPMALG